MTERLPLSATTTDPVEQALLRSVQGDVPGPHALRRTAAALGLGATVFAATGSSAGALASPAVTSGVAVSLPWLAVKAVVLGALCGSAALVGVNAVTAPKSQLEHRLVLTSSSATGTGLATHAPALASTQFPAETIVLVRSDAVGVARVAARTSVRVQPGGDTPHPVAPLTPSVDATLGVASPAAAVQKQEPRFNVVPTRSSVPARPTNADTLSPDETHPAVSSMGEEIATIDLARQALREGNARSALAELDRYRSRWPGGVFGMEALVLRVEALLVIGDRVAAERIATSVIVAHPNSRYATRIRALIGSPKSNDQNRTLATGKGL